jgi:hypothetical protein
VVVVGAGAVSSSPLASKTGKEINQVRAIPYTPD